MKRTIFVKVFGAHLLIVVAFAALIIAFSFQEIRSHYLGLLTHDLQNLGITLRSRILPMVKEGQLKELDALVKQLGKDINTRITLVNPEGVVLADSESDPHTMGNHKYRPEILGVLMDHFGTSLRFSTTVREEMLYVALPIEQNGSLVGVLRVSLFLKDINRLLNVLKEKIAYSALIIMLISLAGAFFFTRSLSKPIRELTGASKKVAAGDFNVSVFLKNRDELQELANSFNYMTEQIRILFSQLSLQKEQSHSIVSSIQEGLLVIDRHGKIVLSNESFKRIIHKTGVEEKFYWELIREPQFNNLIQKVKDEKKNCTEEIALNGNTFLCSATFLSSREEVVVILYDISEMKRVEQIKRDFVVNVSHELRTPLTAIKGFVETLEEEIDEENRHYVDIIRKHTDRLINIVQDLLLLSSLEDKGMHLELEEVDIVSMVERTLKIFEHRAKEKHLTLGLKVEEQIPPIEADPFKLEQVFVNLIDNAIKYTEKGAITIFLKLKENNLLIEISDTGLGIPSTHIPRIFERFYVVDKSRSKKLGGTGLGLSIVKHIVLLHNGTIDLASTPDEGTTFSITLPITLS